MRIWNSDHVFSHPWDTVVKASLRKYPNPLNSAVKGIDVLDREIKDNGTLRSHRLIMTEWGFPRWACRLLGMSSGMTVYASEHSEINPTEKTMTLISKNITFGKELNMVEKITYIPHPENPESQTLLKQEAMITVHGVPLSSYLEDFITKNVSLNANKGRQAMEYVIGKLNSEMQEFTKSIDSLTVSVKKCIEEEMKHYNLVNQVPKN